MHDLSGCQQPVGTHVWLRPSDVHGDPKAHGGSKVKIKVLVEKVNHETGGYSATVAGNPPLVALADTPGDALAEVGAQLDAFFVDVGWENLGTQEG